MGNRPLANDDRKTLVTPCLIEHDIPHRFEEISDICSYGVLVVSIEIFKFRSLDGIKI